MENIKEKFKKKINFVQPLYKKVYPKVKTPNTGELTRTSVDIDNTVKLYGNAVDVQSRVTRIRDYKLLNKNNSNRLKGVLPGTCLNNDSRTSYNYSVRDVSRKSVGRRTNMLGIVENVPTKEVVTLVGDKADTKIYKLPDTWLRVYPAPKLPNETVCSVILRCMMCQLGLASFLVLWTTIWVLVLNNIEGPYEIKVSADFIRDQNQLVIDLATELRQITPLSPKWRKSIEDRIDAERKLTIEAVGRGARLHPGHFWDLAGTSLFTVYVMTALGFGAPVPQTVLGRWFTIIYAGIAIPLHIYLMVHLSTFVVVQVEYYINILTTASTERINFEKSKNGDTKDLPSHEPDELRTAHFGVNPEYKKAIENIKNPDSEESPNCSRNSELIKSNGTSLRRKITRVLSIMCIGQGIPLATLLYYILGLTTFGLARGKQPLEIIMFPLEFTTSGGLEHVECYVRMLYGLYVEGAMVLLSCALATVRRNSSGAIYKIADKYRLFITENNDEDSIFKK